MLKQPFHWMYILTDSTNLENTMLQCQICSLQSLKLITKNRRLVGKWYWITFGLFTKRRTGITFVHSPMLLLYTVLHIHCWLYQFVTKSMHCAAHILYKKTLRGSSLRPVLNKLDLFSPPFLKFKFNVVRTSYNLQMYNAFIKKNGKKLKLPI